MGRMPTGRDCGRHFSGLIIRTVSDDLAKTLEKTYGLLTAGNRRRGNDNIRLRLLADVSSSSTPSSQCEEMVPAPRYLWACRQLGRQRTDKGQSSYRQRGRADDAGEDGKFIALAIVRVGYRRIVRTVVQASLGLYTFSPFGLCQSNHAGIIENGLAQVSRLLLVLTELEHSGPAVNAWQPRSLRHIEACSVASANLE